MLTLEVTNNCIAGASRRPRHQEMVSLMRVAAAASRANLNIVSGSVSDWSSGARQREGVDTRASNDGRDFTITGSLLPPLMAFALMSQFHQEKALLGAFSVIVNTDGSFSAVSQARTSALTMETS